MADADGGVGAEFLVEDVEVHMKNVSSDAGMSR
jgi:hypothetical protein